MMNIFYAQYLQAFLSVLYSYQFILHGNHNDCVIYIYSCVVYDQTIFECFDQSFWPISPLIRENVGEDNHIYSCS